MTQWAMRLADAAQTESAGAAVGQVLAGRAGAVVWLLGDLGAGKTTLARGCLRALGVTGAVRSPTYTLIEPYQLDGCSVLHMDLYRLRDPQEWWELGLDGFPPERCLWLVEWPEQAPGLVPAPTLALRLRPQDGGRRLEIEGEDELVSRLQHILQSQL